MMVLGALPALLVGAALATATWLAARRMLRRPWDAARYGLEAEAAIRRHPAGRARWGEPTGFGPQSMADVRFSRPAGPDDDDEFISALASLIKSERENPEV